MVLAVVFAVGGLLVWRFRMGQQEVAVQQTEPAALEVPARRLVRAFPLQTPKMQQGFLHQILMEGCF